MKAKDWRRTKEIFDAVVSLDSNSRELAVEEACGDDEALRREVESLLRAHDEAGSFIEAPAMGGAAEVSDDGLRESHTGRKVGAWQVHEQIGEGGMGSVYRASRIADDFEQIAALKILRTGLESRELETRFRNERQILAALSHPNIARLIDGGSTEEGRPFLAREYIEGLPIDRYCDEHRLSVRERVELLRRVCMAVQYAHRNLIVHRDVKPSNILVTADGEPKLLDFGIAKLLGDDPLGSLDPLATATHVRLMTRPYASPEQILGEPITTASDVYSLGVLAFELLCGRLPYEPDADSPNELERAITSAQPLRLSSAVSRSRLPGAGDRREIEQLSSARGLTPKALRRRLKGDLDNILLLALQKDPARRYPSVEQLDADLRRHLEHQPVVARGESTVYRTARFVRRHRAGVAAAVAFLALIAFHTWRLAHEQRVARAEALKAEQISEFLQEMLGAADPYADGRDVKVADLLDRAAQRVDADLREQAEVADAVRRTLGTTYGNLGLYDKATELLESTLASQRNRAEEGSEVATTLLALAATYRQNSRFEDAARATREAVELLESAGARTESLGKAYRELGIASHDLGRYEEAEDLLLESTRLLEAAEAPPIERARTLDALGRTYERTARFELARAALGRALELKRLELGDDHMELERTTHLMAVVLGHLGDLEASEALFRASLERSRRHLGNDHREVAGRLDLLAQVLRDRGRVLEAIELHREALAIRRRILEPDHIDLGYSYFYLSVALRQIGDLEAALERGLESIAQTERALGAEHPDIAFDLINLAKINLDLDRPARAAKRLETAREVLEAHFDAKDPRLQEVYDLLGTAYALLGRRQAADNIRSLLGSN